MTRNQAIEASQARIKATMVNILETDLQVQLSQDQHPLIITGTRNALHKAQS